MRDELASMTKLACVHSPETSHRYCQMGGAIRTEAINSFWSRVMVMALSLLTLHWSKELKSTLRTTRKSKRANRGHSTGNFLLTIRISWSPSVIMAMFVPEIMNMQQIILWAWTKFPLPLICHWPEQLKWRVLTQWLFAPLAWKDTFHCSVGLLCLAGDKLPPMTIFKRKMPPEVVLLWHRMKKAGWTRMWWSCGCPGAMAVDQMISSDRSLPCLWWSMCAHITPRASQIACPDARGYQLFILGYQKLSIFVSIKSSPVARKVIRATKHNKDL